MTTQLIDPQEYGLDATEAQQVSAVFLPMIQKMEEIESEYNDIVRLTPTIENCKKAKELRIRIVKIRTGTAEIHKQAKAYYLNGGRFVDGFKNTVTFALTGKEQELEKLEKYFENIEKERIAKLQEERIKLISQYVEDYTHLQLGAMADDVWNAYYSSKQKEYNDRIDAEKKAEADRIEAEKARAEEQKRIKEENDILIAEAQAREKQLAEERAEAQKKQKELEDKVRAEAQAREKLEKEKKDLEEKARKEKEANERLKKEENYKKFIADNEGKFDKIIKGEGKVVLYKKVSEFII